MGIEKKGEPQVRSLSEEEIDAVGGGGIVSAIQSAMQSIALVPEVVLGGIKELTRCN